VPTCNGPQYFVWPATFPPGEPRRLFVARKWPGVGRGVSSKDELEFRMCPVCRGKMKLARAGGHPKVSTYQCLSCKEVMTVEDSAGSCSYFEWLMSRPKSKRALSKARVSPHPRHFYPATAPLSSIPSNPSDTAAPPPQTASARHQAAGPRERRSHVEGHRPRHACGR